MGQVCLFTGSKTLKKYWSHGKKYWKSLGKVRESCQSRKAGTLCKKIADSPYQRLAVIFAHATILELFIYLCKFLVE